MPTVIKPLLQFFLLILKQIHQVKKNVGLDRRFHTPALDTSNTIYLRTTSGTIPYSAACTYIAIYGSIPPGFAIVTQPYGITRVIRIGQCIVN